MHPLTPAVRPFQRIAIDCSGNQKIVVITDYHSRYAIAVAVPREDSSVLANILIKVVILRYGAPSTVLSDRGKSFRTQLIRQVYSEFGIDHITSTAHHPQTNGLVERFNKTLSIMMSIYGRRDHRDWDKYLPHAVFAYNTTIQDSTGYSPFLLVHGSEAVTPLVPLIRTLSS